MRILHICLANFYIDGFSYQENELTKYHKKLGHDVRIIASCDTFDSDGRFVRYTGEPSYLNEHGIPVRRLSYKKPEKIYSVLRRYQGLGEALEESGTDIIFIHGCQFLDIDKVARYVKRHPGIKVFTDNHADYFNSAKNPLSRTVLHGIIWKRCAHIIEPYTVKFYGVVPLRVDFLKDVYKLPPEKCELLVMGADDEAVEKALSPGVREKRRTEYGVSDGDTVIVTGGKIDSNKPQTLDLMRAVNSIDDSRLKLMVFGSVVPELKEEFDRQLSDRVSYIGWRRSETIYEDLAAADIVAFPGLHSVLWEQAVSMGKPCLFKRIRGFGHIDTGGNCMFFENDSVGEYRRVVQAAVRDLETMKTCAEGDGRKTFSYKAIAQRALEG